MSTEDPPKAEPIPEERKKKLLEMIEAGVDPSKVEKDPVKNELDTVLAINEEDRKNNEKLNQKLDDLTDFIKKREVDGQRTELLDEIKELSEETYKEEKDNHSLNELQASLRALRKTSKKQSKRDVGAKEKGEEDEAPKTQWSYLKKKYVSG